MYFNGYSLKAEIFFFPFLKNDWNHVKKKMEQANF